MEKKYLYIGVGVVAAIIIIYLLFIRTPATAPNTRTEADFVEFREQVGDAPGILECIGELDEETRKRIQQSGMLVENYRQTCLTQLATEGEPIVRDCRFIGMVSGKDELVDICYSRVGKVQKQIEPCDFVADPATCRIEVATETNNCTILVEEAEADDCWQQMALKKEDPKFCDNIQDSWWRDTCYMSMVRETGDRDLCDKIEDKYFKLTC